MTDAETIRQLRATIRSLEDEVTQLRDLLIGDSRDEHVFTLRKTLGVTKQVARLLYALYRAQGYVVPFERLAMIIGHREIKTNYTKWESPFLKLVHVQVHHAKKAHPYIKNAHGEGYYMTDDGRAIIKRILDAPQDV